jgi:hypothetical protein
VSGLLFDKAKRRFVLKIRPRDSPPPKVIAQRLNRSQELPLFHSECADGEVNRGAIPQSKEDLKKGQGVLAARQRDGYAIAVADHPVTADRLTHLPKQSSFEVQIPLWSI